MQTVYVERVTYEDRKILRHQIEEHFRLTGSPKARRLLDAWDVEALKFKKVFPMDYKKVTYLKTMNWQQAFAILYPNGKTFTPCLVPVVNKSFIVEGERYSW